jgi:hypothetical protein
MLKQEINTLCFGVDEGYRNNALRNIEGKIDDDDREGRATDASDKCT